MRRTKQHSLQIFKAVGYHDYNTSKVQKGRSDTEQSSPSSSMLGSTQYRWSLASAVNMDQSQSTVDPHLVGLTGVVRLHYYACDEW